MTRRIEDLRVIANKRIKSDFCIIELSGNHSVDEFKPGHFVQVRVDGSPETFLRRPISIHDVDYANNTFKLLIQVVGKGTETLYRTEAGAMLNLIYPLGNSFSTPLKDEKVLLVGGGCGVAPLLFLGKHLRKEGIEPDFLLGYRNTSRVIEYEEYQKVGKVYLTTEDGSGGEKGFVTGHSILSSLQYDRIFCCGPDPMMRAVSSYCSARGISCEVSLENLMGCGIGVCLCCVVETTRGNLCTCVDGPVFNINDLKW